MFIKYFDTKLDGVKIHNSSVYFCTWGSIERVSWARFGSRVTDNKSSVWNITKATMRNLLERNKLHKLAASYLRACSLKRTEVCTYSV